MQTVNTETFVLPRGEAMLYMSMLGGDTSAQEMFDTDDRARATDFITHNRIKYLVDAQDIENQQVRVTFVLDPETPRFEEYIFVLFGATVRNHYDQYGLLPFTTEPDKDLDRNVVRKFTAPGQKEMYLKGLSDANPAGVYTVVENLPMKMLVFWHSLPEVTKRVFSVMPSNEKFWASLDLATKIDIYNWCIIKENGIEIDEDDEHALLDEITEELAERAMVFVYNKPYEEMTDGQGGYLDKYDDEAARMYDDIRNIISGFDYSSAEGRA